MLYILFILCSNTIKMVNLGALDISAFIITTLSIIFTVLTIIAHLTLTEMLVHPGHLVFYQCISLLIVDLHWYTSLSSLSQ